MADITNIEADNTKLTAAQKKQKAAHKRKQKALEDKAAKEAREAAIKAKQNLYNERRKEMEKTQKPRRTPRDRYEQEESDLSPAPCDQ